MDQLHADAIRRAIEAASTHRPQSVGRLRCALVLLRVRRSPCSLRDPQPPGILFGVPQILFPHGIDWRLASR